MKKLARTPWFQRATGLAAAHYLRLVWHTTSFIIEPADAIEQIPKHAPIIVAMWHGQHFLMPFIRPKDIPAKVLISRHHDGEINAIAAEWLASVRGDAGGVEAGWRSFMSWPNPSAVFNPEEQFARVELHFYAS